MQDKNNQQYGLWPSEITVQQVASASVRYSSVCFDGDEVYWLEGRPQEKGRTTVVRRRGGKLTDLLPAPWNVRSRVHEYGGGALAVHAQQFWFVNDADQQVYHYCDGVVKQITNEPGCRFADLVYTAAHQCLFAIREDHRDTESHEPENTLVQINLSSAVVTRVAGGDDFYAAPAVSPDGNHLAWLSWCHPNMPWDANTLWLAELDADGLARSTRKMINAPNQAVFQPSWSPDGRLYFVNDPASWWQLYRLNNPADVNSVEQVSDYEAEMGLPLWQFAMRTYGFQDENNIIALLCEQGIWRLTKLCANTGEVEAVDTPFNVFSSLAVGADQIAVVAAGATEPDQVALIQGDTVHTISRAAATVFSEDWLSPAQAIRFATSDNATAYGFYYPPKNPHHPAVPGLPPLIVMSHGGPTGATSAGLSLRTQYWTSRGFAVLDVNYRGSTGYGRAYREQLKGQWGVYDVDDVVAGARHLAEQGLVDPARLAIRGSSAGGYTTLAALTFRDSFAVGASYYGIGELESLAKDTHKFEARYLDSLVGRYPQDRSVYLERSPLHHADQLSCPVIFMQGAEDKVVPPAQAEQMIEAMRARGLVCEILLFEGEQHGFRKAETIEKTLQAELNFYNRFFNPLQSD